MAGGALALHWSRNGEAPLGGPGSAKFPSRLESLLLEAEGLELWASKAVAVVSFGCSEEVCRVKSWFKFLNMFSLALKTSPSNSASAECLRTSSAKERQLVAVSRNEVLKGCKDIGRVKKN